MFEGEGYLALVPSCLPHLSQLVLSGCHNVRDKYIEELMAALPELEIVCRRGKRLDYKHMQIGELLKCV